LLIPESHLPKPSNQFRLPKMTDNRRHSVVFNRPPSMRKLENVGNRQSMAIGRGHRNEHYSWDEHQGSAIRRINSQSFNPRKDRVDSDTVDAPLSILEEMENASAYENSLVEEEGRKVR
jgi:hypothetical protein